jgi:hypothetical protein
MPREGFQRKREKAGGHEQARFRCDGFCRTDAGDAKPGKLFSLENESDRSAGFILFSFHPHTRARLFAGDKILRYECVL